MREHRLRLLLRRRRSRRRRRRSRRRRRQGGGIGCGGGGGWVDGGGEIRRGAGDGNGGGGSGGWGRGRRRNDFAGIEETLERHRLRRYLPGAPNAQILGEEPTGVPRFQLQASLAPSHACAVRSQYVRARCMQGKELDSTVSWILLLSAGKSLCRTGLCYPPNRALASLDTSRGLCVCNSAGIETPLVVV